MINLFIFIFIFFCNFCMAATTQTSISSSGYTSIFGPGGNGALISAYLQSECIFSPTLPSSSTIGHRLQQYQTITINSIDSSMYFWCKSNVTGTNYIISTLNNEAGLNGNDQSLWAASSVAQGIANNYLDEINTKIPLLALETGGNLATIATNTAGVASAANQTATQALAGNSATKAISVQGISGGVQIPVTGNFYPTTQPVSGTFWQNIQPVSGTVTADAGTGTFAISAASLPLPSGASTSALQNTANSSLSSIVSNTASAIAGNNSYRVLSTSTTTTIKSGAGVLHAITIGGLGVLSTAQCYDNTEASGTSITGSINTTLGLVSLIYDAAFTNGLTCVTTGTTPSNLTVSYH